MMSTPVQVAHAPCLPVLVSLCKLKRYQTSIDELQGEKEQRHFHDAAQGFLENNFCKPVTKKNANDGNARQDYGNLQDSDIRRSSCGQKTAR
jgi:hypothetical protein